jgi:D-alanine-D-alanine ligase
MKTRVGLVFGGRSGEHEISVRSAASVIANVNKDKHEIVPIGITREGAWLSPADSIKLLPADAHAALLNANIAAEVGAVAILADTSFHGLTRLSVAGDSDREITVDVIMPVLHGPYGEDGTLQGLLELAAMPYVGCGVLASACGMDKVVMKALFRDAALPICRYVWFLRGEWENNPTATVSLISAKLGFPCFVKPANLGSSVGVSRADDDASLRRAIEIAALYDRKIIVEESLDMREIECAVIGNNEPEASLPGEYIIKDETKKFLDYAEKYTGTGNNEFTVPALISAELSAKVRQTAVQAFKAIDASGLARVDFFLRKDTGALVLNEINTLPGLTDASGFPKMWEGTGMSFGSIIDKLIDLAFERHGDKMRNQSSFQLR